MDTPVQLLNQVLLKETHHKRYKEVSKRESDDSVINSFMSNPSTGGIFRTNVWTAWRKLTEPSLTATRSSKSFVYKFKKIIIFYLKPIWDWTKTTS